MKPPKWPACPVCNSDTSAPSEKSTRWLNRSHSHARWKTASKSNVTITWVWLDSLTHALVVCHCPEAHSYCTKKKNVIDYSAQLHLAQAKLSANWIIWYYLLIKVLRWKVCKDRVSSFSARGGSLGGGHDCHKCMTWVVWSVYCAFIQGRIISCHNLECGKCHS